jgi:spermidine/putrescine ABC transporter ATP-binding subunit
MSESAAAVLQLRSVSIRYGETIVVRDVSFEVQEGEFVTLLGPSGSGKTSILRVIAGFVQPSAGELYLQGERINSVPAYARDVGMVFQSYALFPHMTVRRNLEFGLQMNRVPRHEREQRVAESLEYVRLTGFESRYPHELSGGQQQRVAVARALAIRPRLLLLDEPMSNLDARLRASMRLELRAILDGIGITTISVTHNQEEALSMSDRVVVLTNGEIKQIGTPAEIYRTPTDAFVANFIGDANVVEGEVVGQIGGLTCIRTDWGQEIQVNGQLCADDKTVVLLIRPEVIHLTQEPIPEYNSTRAVLSQVAYMGAFLEYRFTVGAREFIVKQPARDDESIPNVGEQMMLCWSPSSMVRLNR